MVVEDRRVAYHEVRARWEAEPAPVWGKTDCACFVLDVISRLLGRDARDTLTLPCWATQREAAAAIVALAGEGSLASAIRAGAKRLGLRKIYSPMAQAGDLCLISMAVEVGEKPAAIITAPGIIDPDRHQAAVFRVAGQPGLVGVPQRNIRMAWRVE